MQIQTHDGIVLHIINRFGTDCFVHVIDLKKVRMKICPSFSTVPDAVDWEKAQVGTNGGGWGLWEHDENQPNEFLVVEGSPKTLEAFDDRPWIDISRDGKITIDGGHPNFRKAYNLFGGDRIIAKNGIYNSGINNNFPDPRTIYGADLYGNLVILVCEGRSKDQKGLTFEEVWSVMQEFDVTDCINADGGYSSAVVNTSQLPSLLNKTYLFENRRVVHQILFFANNELPTEQPHSEENMYKVVFPVKSRKTPSMYEETTKGNWPVGHTFESTHQTTKEEMIGGVKHTITWVQDDSDGYWFPMEYKGTIHVVNDGDIVTPPPVGESYITHRLSIWSDGGLDVDDAHYPPPL